MPALRKIFNPNHKKCGEKWMIFYGFNATLCQFIVQDIGIWKRQNLKKQLWLNLVPAPLRKVRQNLIAHI